MLLKFCSLIFLVILAGAVNKHFLKISNQNNN